jgi:phage terminase large subunit-like protein
LLGTFQRKIAANATYGMNASNEKWLVDGGYVDHEQASKATRFIERYIRISTTGKQLILLPWQREFVTRLYGERNADGSRRYRKAILSTAKKNGKTILQSAIIAYELLGAEVSSP